MEIRQLRYFRAVVEAGSFMAAAAVLHMSQPPLSTAIRRLETELGVELLTRSARGVEPTSAGRYLLDAGSRVLGDVDELVEHLRAFGAGTAGELRIAAVPALMWARVPELLREHAAANPGVEIRLVDPPPWGAMDLVAERRADAACILVDDAPAFADRYRDRFETVPWEDVRLVAALPPERHGAPDPLPLASFAQETLVLPRRTLAVPSLPDLVGRALVEHGVVPARVRVAETIQTAIPLVRAGQAVTVLPDAGGHSLAGLGVVIRRLREPMPSLTAVLLIRSGERRPLVERLVDTVSGVARGARPDHGPRSR